MVRVGLGRVLGGVAVEVATLHHKPLFLPRGRLEVLHPAEEVPLLDWGSVAWEREEREGELYAGFAWRCGMHALKICARAEWVIV